MVIVFDALPYPEQALTASQHSALGRYLLVEDWELALERVELLIAACRAAEDAGDDLDTSTESDNARPALARHGWHSAAPADLVTALDDWFDWRPSTRPNDTPLEVRGELHPGEQPNILIWPL